MIGLVTLGRKKGLRVFFWLVASVFLPLGGHDVLARLGYDWLALLIAARRLANRIRIDQYSCHDARHDARFAGRWCCCAPAHSARARGGAVPYECEHSAENSQRIDDLVAKRFL